MTRTCFAALLALCGLTAAAPAQVYTSYYSPGTATYYHAPAYSSYSYTSGYGPLGLVNWGRWAGRPAYTSPYYGSYTAGYSPFATTPVTSYYAPAATTVAYYTTPVASVGSACCTPCCDPCVACASCPGGTCPGGNCGLNYGPVDMTPRPDPAASGSSGSRTYESESNGTGASDADDDFRPYDRERPDDGYDGSSRGAGYRPKETIEQRAPTDLPDEGSEAAPASEAEEELEAPAALLNLDTKITRASSLLWERLPLRARFGSPQLARAKVEPATLPAAVDVRLVRK